MSDAPIPSNTAGGDDNDRVVEVPPEALEPSGRSEESLPTTAPNPATKDPQNDPEDGATEIPPITPDA